MRAGLRGLRTLSLEISLARESSLWERLSFLRVPFLLRSTSFPSRSSPASLCFLSHGMEGGDTLRVESWRWQRGDRRAEKGEMG